LKEKLIGSDREGLWIELWLGIIDRRSEPKLPTIYLMLYKRQILHCS